MEQSAQQFDVVISGGGLSGSLMALSLSELVKSDGSKLAIAIIEANPKSDNQGQHAPLFDDRVLALSHGSARYLEKLSVWQHLQQDACAIADIDISDRGHFAKARLSAAEYHVNALGYVIDMALIGRGLLKVLANKTNVHWFNPDKIEDINWQEQHVDVALQSGTCLQGKLLLACDGVKSPCRERANIEVSFDDYQQVALIANVATQKPHLHKAYERFSNQGPIAMLPLPQSKAQAVGQGRCSLVWTMTPDEAERIQALSDDDFKRELESAFGLWLGQILHVGKRDVYPLVLLQAKQQTYHRMALVGNSSHTIHPIAGQGFNLGLRDVADMASLIAEQLNADMLNSDDVGSFALLQKYQQLRSKDQQEVIWLTDSLVRLFANDLPPLVVGRNIGLQMLGALSPFKNALVKKTMGY
ncbi:2-octaprenyl-6-methoxyphenyl hydroxylase [Litorilituus sediminis]|uniref:2-octaprenyl-6-methoxyphenyl hydroxylase n=1 Tax=Litorilituus sediminis TaxID=718192 RepID=A0A4P6P821_9GAMM|nr:2-octaprenyl-6-methoxyphenyl hydroxylase [Litorilituus sediminis]QBG37238.1 2-octaprenyl-6-methoxyphenyl hydroxylase [Litorilituus sediminis]